MKKNCIVAQSGGPTAAINASLAGIMQGISKNGQYDKIYGSIYGIEGVLNKNFLDLPYQEKEFIRSLATTPAMYLGSCRFRLPDYRADTGLYRKIFSVFQELNVKTFFYIGGNDSMDTTAKLNEYAKEIGSDICIAGVPKTIDNDLILTDHTPGFGSAAKYIATCVREIAYDTYIYNVGSVTIVEIMGRDAGWLTAASALARTSFCPAPDLIYLPESVFDSERFLLDVSNLLSTRKNVIVAVSEGIHDKDGNYICATNAASDKFGHAQLSGAGKVLEHLVKERLGVKVRSVEINVLQRCAGHLASLTDLTEAFLQGEKAVQLSDEGLSGFMTILKRTGTSPYQYVISHAPVAEIANKAKSVPPEWIAPSQNDVTSEMLEYLAPLITGEVAISYKDGVACYPDISHLIKQPV